MGKRQRSNSPSSADDDHDSRNNTRDASSSEEGTDTTGMQSLGVFVWSEVSMVLYACMMKELHYTCGLIAMERSRERRCDMIAALQPRLEAFWSRETASLGGAEQRVLAAVFHPHVNAMLERFTSLATRDLTASELCRAFQQTLEAFGFPEEENTDEAQLHANVRRGAELHAYSYSERTGHQLSVLPRYEGDRRTEEQHRQPRAGRVVHFPCPHPHVEINTAVQLIEPKKRRPPLDENRIFSHPKKATSSGMEDVLVDEELQYRALVVLERHLDTFGSLQHISPFVRFALWNVLGRDEEMFERLCETPSDSDEAAQQQKQLETLRRRLAKKRAAFDATRVAAREAALHVGWAAVSAHWRDQVLSVVEAGEDADWYLLRDTAKIGSRAIFPNYAASSVVKDIALKALRRVRDGHVECAVEDAAECYEVVTDVLFPLLEGTAPSLPPTSRKDDGVSGDVIDGDGSHQQQQQQQHHLRKRVAALAAQGAGSTCSDEQVARGVRWGLDCEILLPQEGSTCAFVTDMFVWPLQCLASLLELIAVGRYAAEGLKKFAAAFLPSNWGDEEAVLEFLVRREPTNIPLASFVGFPRLVRDVFTSAQWLRNDKCFAAVVECRSQAFALPSGASANNYVQWRVLSTLLTALDYGEGVLALTVRPLPPHATEEGKLWSVAELQCAQKTWVDGLALMLTTPASTTGITTTVDAVKTEEG
ncbi:hypothetical protein DQ04_02841030 [Trypanosoma grayi]|uniref:hypothetical protein n=1 Tax=Trypanosoma grayi TaxID=71804 RepID=UPI0004F43762|nr:hypothetical protein DQ04_02841030 [Trypanosoma grayi]KEG11221.1 hypothetical protein DQ04_02841030 [Trypanosoma grayi]